MPTSISTLASSILGQAGAIINATSTNPSHEAQTATIANVISQINNALGQSSNSIQTVQNQVQNLSQVQAQTSAITAAINAATPALSGLLGNVPFNSQTPSILGAQAGIGTFSTAATNLSDSLAGQTASATNSAFQPPFANDPTNLTGLDSTAVPVTLTSRQWDKLVSNYGASAGSSAMSTIGNAVTGTLFPQTVDSTTLSSLLDKGLTDISTHPFAATAGALAAAGLTALGLKLTKKKHHIRRSRRLARTRSRRRHHKRG